MSASRENDAEMVTGAVKWFDPVKGFGFIIAENGGPDILLHANVLRNFGQSSIADGAIVRITVAETPRGKQAQQLLHIEAPADAGASEEGGAHSFDETLVGGPLVPARVKWFDRAKGFGFANVFGSAEDVFVHIEVLRRSALAELQPGEAVALRVAEGQRGKLATQVATWEQGIQRKD